MRPTRQIFAALVCVAVLTASSASRSQTGVHTQSQDNTNPCADADEHDLAECGMEAYREDKFDVSKRAWAIASEHGDYTATFWLAGLYEKGEGAPKDLVQAYKWYDIAAAIHARAIDRMPPVSGPIRENNRMEINYREDVAKSMSASQVADAQKASREWQSAHLR